MSHSTEEESRPEQSLLETALKNDLAKYTYLKASVVDESGSDIKIRLDFVDFNPNNTKKFLNDCDFIVQKTYETVNNQLSSYSTDSITIHLPESGKVTLKRTGLVEALEKALGDDINVIEETNQSHSMIKIIANFKREESPDFDDYFMQTIYKIVNDKLPRNHDYRFLTIQFEKEGELKKVESKLNAPILLEPNEHIFIFTKKIDVLMEEYKTLRQELMGTQASLNNVFYYGLFALGATFAIVQGMAGQMNSLFKPDVQTLELDTSRFHSLTLLLFILLVFVIPAMSFVFIIKWMSNARSISVHGSYLVQVENELNRAFRRIKTFETVMKQQINHSDSSKTTEFSTTTRSHSTGGLFNDYELNIADSN